MSQGLPAGFIDPRRTLAHSTREGPDYSLSPEPSPSRERESVVPPPLSSLPHLIGSQSSKVYTLRVSAERTKSLLRRLHRALLDWWPNRLLVASSGSSALEVQQLRGISAGRRGSVFSGASGLSPSHSRHRAAMALAVRRITLQRNERQPAGSGPLSGALNTRGRREYREL